MDGEEYRITARILREDGSEKTITFRGNPANMESKMRYLFKAVAYKLYRIEDVRFSQKQEWKVIE